MAEQTAPVVEAGVVPQDKPQEEMAHDARTEEIVKAAAAKADEAEAKEAAKYADGTEEVAVGFSKDAQTITVNTMYRDSKDGTKIRICKYGSGDQRLLIVHGAAEWLGRYGYTINFFAEHGFEVTMVELRGHGKSQGPRMFLNHWDEAVADMQTAAATIDGDCTVFAHSNGGLLMAYATSTDQVPTNVKKIVYSNPNIRNVSNVKVRLITWIPFKFSAAAPIKGDDLSSCAEANAHYINDEMVPKILTSSYVTAMSRAQDVVHRNLGTKGASLPCMFVFGSDDKVCNHSKGEEWAVGQRALVGDTHCLIKTYDGLKHEMINGVSRDKLLADIVTWLQPLPEALSPEAPSQDAGEEQTGTSDAAVAEE